MTQRKPADIVDFDRLGALDVGRWAFAFALVIAGGFGAAALARQWTPAAPVVSSSEPVMLIELAPLPEPAPPSETPEPPVPSEPVVEEPPAEPVVEPEAEPVEELPAEPVEELEPEPIPDPVQEPIEPEPEPVQEATPPEPPEPEPEPLPAVDESLVDVAMPVSLPSDLRESRENTPPTMRPRPQPREPQPQPETPRPQQAQPTAPTPQPASTVSPQQWQQQVLGRLDAAKVYPGASQSAGEQGVVVISFTVSANGQIGGVGIARSSGFPALDQAALDTARRASPLPPPPASLASQPLTANIRFALR